jgi:hypothetical protein
VTNTDHHEAEQKHTSKKNAAARLQLRETAGAADDPDSPQVPFLVAHHRGDREPYLVVFGGTRDGTESTVRVPR